MKFLKRSLLIVLLVISMFICSENVRKVQNKKVSIDINKRRLKLYGDEEKSLVKNYLTEISNLRSTISRTNLEEINLYELEEQISKVKVALMILARMGSAHYKKDKINNQKLKEIFNEIKSYRAKYQKIGSNKNHIIEQIHKCSSKLKSIIKTNKVTDDDKKGLLLKLTKEINALKRMQSLQHVVKNKTTDLNQKYSKLKELANTENSSFKSKFNQYYDKVSNDLGIEMRQLDELNKNNNNDYSKEADIAYSMNKEIKNVRDKVLTTINQSKAYVNQKKKINNKLMALVKSQDEIQNLVEETAKKEEDHVRDTRSRAIQILRQYNRNLRYLNKKKLISNKKKVNLSKSKSQNKTSSKQDKKIVVLPDDEEELVNEIERDIDNINAISNDNIKVLAKGKKAKKSSLWYKEHKIKLLNLRNKKLSRDITKLEKDIIVKLHNRWDPKRVNL